jgi:uncharacterized protein (TIGR02186 family)
MAGNAAPRAPSRPRARALLAAIALTAIALAAPAGPAAASEAAGTLELMPPLARSPNPGRPPDSPAAEERRETVQADVSTRSVAITSSFTGTEIIVFGAVDNSRQESAEAGLYDIVIVLEGTPSRLVARRKSNVAGIWINTQSLTFDSVPSYYAIASTRPLEEIADQHVLRDNDIGFEQVRMVPRGGWESGLTTADLEDFKASVIRLKQRDRLYVEEDYGVVFIGRSLFRTSIDLPANVPVGPLEARVHLFRHGQLLHTYNTRVSMQREGLELLLHKFAIDNALLYGIFTVSIAIAAGLLAAQMFRKGSH